MNGGLRPLNSTDESQSMESVWKEILTPSPSVTYDFDHTKYKRWSGLNPEAEGIQCFRMGNDLAVQNPQLKI